MTDFEIGEQLYFATTSPIKSVQPVTYAGFNTHPVVCSMHNGGGAVAEVYLSQLYKCKQDAIDFVQQAV